MGDLPRYGQRSLTPRQEQCPKHPGRQAVAYCKRCNRPACEDCAIPTEVGSICVDCAGRGARRRWKSAGKPSFWAKAQAPVTMTLIAINVLMYLVDKAWPELFQYTAMTPLIAKLQPWRMLTTTFLHGGFFHLLFNMLMLYLLGASIEKVFGWWRYLTLYVVSALGGSIAVLAWVFADPISANTVVVGASGAIFGLFGAVFVVQKKSGMSTQSILVLLGINLVYGFVVPGISWQAHLGGFFLGLAVAATYFFVGEKARSRRQYATWGVLVTLLMLLVTSGGAVLLANAAFNYALTH